MGTQEEFNKVKLFSGFIFKENHIYESIKKELEDFFSEIDIESEPFSFDLTTYYNKEMGFPLFRRFVSFKDPVAPETLPEIKIFTNEIEDRTAISGKRVINIDPGYLSDSNIVIATTKNHYHRIPLQKGIYAHIEYIIKKKKITTLEWTYPDFKKPEYIDFFSKLRLLYKNNTGK